MCGIAGFLFPPDRIPKGINELLHRMTSSLAHRGPNDEGAWIDSSAGVALGHRRLSIIDLSPAGQQPMVSPTGRYVIAFNGEIYNHLEIRRELEHTRQVAPQWKTRVDETSALAPWRGTSDTESLLAAIEAWGVREALTRCAGMFAFALWDTTKRTLTLARDRMGEKPLYYGRWTNMFLFSSEVRAFKALPGFSPSIDREALWHYLCQKAVPAPLSIYEGIKKLEPGQMLTLEARSNPPLYEMKLDRYWSVKNSLLAPQFRGSPEDAVIELERLLLRSVGSQMLADVPVGAFLSGGIDSSVVVALMQASSQRKVRTYSIGFEETTYNEAPHAAAVAQCLGTDHHALTVTATEALATIPRLAEIWDEPFADSSQIPTALLAEFARGGVTVALSGDGGDELFCGYKRQLTAVAIEKLPIKPLLSSLLLAIGSSSSAQVHLRALPIGQQPKSVANRLRILATALASTDPAQRYMALSFQPEYWTFLLRDRTHYKLDPAEVCCPRGCDMLSLVSAFDALTYLPTDILAKVDRAAMAASLEARAPLLDHRIVEFAFSLPSDYKVRDGHTKWPLRQVLQSYVPSSLIDRPKMGFSVPIDQWLRGPLRTWAEDLLFARTCQDDIFDLSRIRMLWRDHQAGRWNYADHLWRLLMFRAWQTRYG